MLWSHTRVKQTIRRQESCLSKDIYFIIIPFRFMLNICEWPILKTPQVIIGSCSLVIFNLFPNLNSQDHFKWNHKNAINQENHLLVKIKIETGLPKVSVTFHLLFH